MTLETLLINPAVQSLGWALLHFVWQGAVLAALLFVANKLTRRSQARLRYALGCIVMLLMVAVFVATIFRGAWFRVPDSSAQGAGVVVTSNADAAPAVGAVLTSGGTVLPRSDGSAWYSAAVLPGWVVCIWLVGVAGLSMYTAGGWLRVRRLSRRGIERTEPAWIAKLESLMRRLHVSRPVRLYQSAVAQAPTVIGWLRPCILLPVSAVIGLDEAQLRAVLAHELAHIRRYDYLVNLLQNAVETLLFYHPAVWWVSGKIREEREHCCDDLAVAVCGDVMVYAGALAQLEELRGSISGPALAATGGDLLARVRRLVGKEVTGRDRIPGSVGWTLAATLVLGAVMVVGNTHWIRAQPPAMALQRASAPSSASPTFEVASVKINPSLGRSQDPGPRLGAIQYSPDTLTMRKMSMWLMVRWAYGLGSFQISAPDWMRHPLPPFYDIVAKASGSVRRSQMQLMLRTLLAERFHLAVHWEKKEMPVTALLVGRDGPRLHESTGRYDPARGAEAPVQFLGLDNNVHIQRTWDQGRLRDSYTDVPMNLFASLLAMWASQTPYDNVPVLDMTGLQGRYDFTLVMDRPSGGTSEGGDAPRELSSPDNLLADFKRILPKQLGLTLERRKAPVDVLVIDRVDKEPTPD
jgi:uncharacterized protein (TIGR03435 family)